MQKILTTLMEETFSGRNFRSFWHFLRKFIPHNILKDVIRKSVFLRNISLYVDCKSLFPQNSLGLYLNCQKQEAKFSKFTHSQKFIPVKYLKICHSRKFLSAKCKNFTDRLNCESFFHESVLKFYMFGITR